MQIAMRDILTAKRRAAPGPTPWEPFWISSFNDTEIPIYHNAEMSFLPSLEYSYDKISWTPIVLAQEDITYIDAPHDTKVYFRSGPGGNRGITDIDLNSFTTFSDMGWSSSAGIATIGGNILSLLSQSELTELPQDVTSSCFSSLFGYSSYFVYYDASQLVLPRTTVPYMYDSLFYGAASLVQAPFLPAEQLAEGCYGFMFSDCVSLSEIRTAQLSFYYGCQDWLYNVSDSGTFYCPAALGTDATIERGGSACPEGWTVVNF